MSKNSIAIKGCMEQADLSELLEGIVASFKAGTVCVRKGSEFVTLKPLGRLDFEIEAEAKKGKQSLTLEIKWADEVITKPACEGFSISSTEPEPEPEAAPVIEPVAPAGEAAPAKHEAAKAPAHAPAKK